MEPAATSSLRDRAMALMQRSFDSSDLEEKLLLAQEAGAFFERLTASTPDDPLIWSVWADCFVFQAMSSLDARERASLIAEVSAKYGTAVRLSSIPEEIHLRWGNALGALASHLKDVPEIPGIWKEVAMHLRTVLSLNPGHWRARFQLVDCCFEQLELTADPAERAILLRDATALADAACENDPRVSAAWLLQGRCLYLQAGDSEDPAGKRSLLEGAECKFKIASELDPEDGEAFWYLGLALEDQMPLPGPPPDHHELSKSSDPQRLLLSRAVDAYETAFVLGRDVMNYCLSGGQALLRLASYSEDPATVRELLQRAQQRLEAALALDPISKDIRRLVADSLEQQGKLASDPGEAQQRYQAALDQYTAIESFSSADVGTLVCWGRTLVKLSDCVNDDTVRHALWNQARDKFQRAIAKGDAQVAYLLAQFEVSRDHAAALAALRHWRDHSPHAALSSINHHSIFAPLREHPEFIAILKSLGG